MELITAITIGGKQFTQKPLTAKDYFEYERRKINQSIQLANEWLIYESFGESGTGLKFRDKGRLLLSITNTKVIKNDDLPLSESSDFSVCGNQFTEVENSGDYFDQFIAKSATDAIAAYQWVIPKIFLINGQTITQQHFDKPSPEGIGFEGMAVLVQWLSSFLSPQ